MRIILDTNVFVSGLFFTGPPSKILKAWNEGKLQLVISEEILEEYQRVGGVLAKQFPGVSLRPMLDLLSTKSHPFPVRALADPICQDPDDDKLIACAITSKCKVIVSGDRHLLKVSGFRVIEVLKPRTFIDQYLTQSPSS